MADVVFVTVVGGRCDLSEDPPGLLVLEALAVAQVVVELAAGRDFHDEDHLFLVLEN